ncbi:MAG: MoaD/ThiS family protein [Deltaproteobacteria bacterium]|nr:MoaD/ThiS family protein [Deltaproteobacteria bacterium]
MKVRVKFIGFPDMKRLLGGKEIDIQFEGITFADLLKHLKQLYGEPFHKALLNDRGLVDNSVQVVRNELVQVAREDLSFPLREGDTITFLFMMAGG